MIFMNGKTCTKCGEWKILDEFYKDKSMKDGRKTQCKNCIKEREKQYYKDNAEYRKEYGKQYRQNNKEKIKESSKQYRQNNEEKIKKSSKQWRENNSEYGKQYREKNAENIKQKNKQWYEGNKNYYREYFKTNKERIHAIDKKARDKKQANNIERIKRELTVIDPIFAELNLPVYGYIYKLENIKTGRVYIGQTVRPLNRRYASGGVVKSWIDERTERGSQRFIEELIERDFVVTEVLDVAFCKWHLNTLEVYYIDKYDSYNNGYNNTAGNHITDDGKEEFMEILQRYNLEFINGRIVKKVN